LALTSGGGLQLDEFRRGDLRIGVLEDAGDLVAVEVAVEANGFQPRCPTYGGT
jgi:hypothetical protein